MTATRLSARHWKAGYQAIGALDRASLLLADTSGEIRGDESPRRQALAAALHAAQFELLQQRRALRYALHKTREADRHGSR